MKNWGHIADQVMPAYKGEYLLKKKDGNTNHIIEQILSTFKESSGETRQLAPALQGDSKYSTCLNIWSFIKEHIKYKEDPTPDQYCKTPAATWGSKVADCKSYSILAASILYCLGIPFKFRFASYTKEGPVTHVYVVVPDAGELITIDAVLPNFNQQKPYCHKKDYTMSDVYKVSGVDKKSPSAQRGFRKVIKKLTNLGSKSLADMTAAEMDLFIARDRLMTEQAIVSKLKPESRLIQEKYQNSIDMVEDAINVVQKVSGISSPRDREDVAYELQLIARDAVNGVYSIHDAVMGVGKAKGKEVRQTKRDERKASRELRKEEKKEVREERKEIRETTSGKEQRELLKKSREEHGTKTGDFLRNVADKVKEGAKAVADVVSAPIKLAAKGILEVSLPKASPAFLYLFIQKPEIIAKLPVKVKAKRDKAQKIKDFIVNTIGMKENHFMGIVRNGIMKKFGMSPEKYIEQLFKGKLSGIGLLAEAFTVVKEIVQKLFQLLGKKQDIDLTEEDMPGPEDGGSWELADEVKRQQDGVFDVNDEGSTTGGGKSIWNTLG